MATNDSTNNTLFGSTNASNATAGYVGEFISSQILSGSPVAITTTTTPQNLTSISLTAGDWDVWGNVYFLPALSATTVITGLFCGINSVSATFPDGSLYSSSQIAFATGQTEGFAAPSQRISISSTTTMYIVMQANFTVSTMSACGGIYARRRR